MYRLETLKREHLLIALVILFLGYTIASTSIYSFEATDLGLVSKLPVTFWISLIFLSCLWYIGRDSKYYMAAAFILTFVCLYVLPTIVRVPPWISTAYYPYGETKLILSEGHVVERSGAPLLSYHEWPSFLYLASTIKLVTNLPDTIIIKYMPLLTILLYGLLIFLILKVHFKTFHSILGATWFLSGFFMRQYYFGPEGIAYIFFLLFFLIISWLFFEKRAKKRVLIAIALFLFTLITFTHALASLMSLGVVVALFLTRKLVHGRQPPVAGKLCLLLAGIWLFYNVYIASIFFKMNVVTFYQVFGGQALGFYREASRLMGSAAQALSYVSSWAIVFVNVGIALVAILLLMRHPKAIRSWVPMREYMLFCVILLVGFGLFGVTMEYGPHEAYQRAFMFGLVPLSYIFVSLLTKRPKILFIILIGLVFLNIPAQFGSDSYRLVTNTELAGTQFFGVYTPQTTSLLYKTYSLIWYQNPLKVVKFQSIGTLPYTSMPNSTVVEKAIHDADYVILSDLQNNYYIYYLGVNPLDEVVLKSELNRIYDNSRLNIFKQANVTKS